MMHPGFCRTTGLTGAARMGSEQQTERDRRVQWSPRVSPDLARHTLALLERLRSATILAIAKPNEPTNTKTPDVNIRKQSNGSNGGEVLSGMKARRPKYPRMTIARPATTVYQNLRLAFITWCNAEDEP